VTKDAVQRRSWTFYEAINIHFMRMANTFGGWDPPMPTHEINDERRGICDG
jgi:hypothetical protein